MLSLRAFVVALLLVLMEVLSGFAVVVGSSLLDATSLSYSMFWPILGAALAGFLAQLAENLMRLRYPWNRVAVLTTAVVVAGGLGAALATSTVALIVSLFLFTAAFWRGMSVVTDEIHLGMVQRRFNTALAVYFVGVIWVVARGIIFEGPVWRMLALLGVALLLVSLAALVTARVAERREPGALPAIALAVGLQLLLLVVLSVGALALLSHDVGAWLSAITRPFWDVVSAIAGAIISVVVLFVSSIIELVRPNGHHAHVLRPPTPNFNPHGNGKTLKPRHHTYPLADLIATILAIVIVAGILVGVGMLLWKAMPSFERRERDSGFEEEREGTFALRLLWEALVTAFRRLFRRSITAAEGAVGATRRRVFGPEYPHDPVRRIYAQVLYRARRLGLDRPAAQTPQEFVYALSAVWPAGAEDFGAITRAYMARRYGEIDPQPYEVAALRERWERVQAIMRRVEPEVAPETPAGAQAVAIQRRVSLVQRLRNNDVLLDTLRRMAGGTLTALVASVVSVLVLVLVLALFILAGR